MTITTNSSSPLSFNNTTNSWQYLQFQQNATRKAWMGLNSTNDFCIYKENGGGIKLSGTTNLYYSVGDAWANAFRSNVTGSYVKSMIVSLNGDERFYVTGNGEVWAKGYLQSSDKNLKKDITKIDNALEKVLQLEGVSYLYKDAVEADSSNMEGFFEADSNLAGEDFSSEGSNTNKSTPDTALNARIEKEKARKHLGLIAQDVEPIVPEVVRTSADGTLAIDYTSLVGLLIEAIKEQNIEIEKLKAANKQEPKLKAASNDFQESFENTATLSQNKPNPFNQETTIDFYLTSTISNATIYIYDLQGKQLKNISIAQREYGSVTIYANELQPGMYKYALIADGVIVGAKTMILTN
ncbi:MAG: tail fiber domain-containing protein [Bacteroidota bacterium]|nr:MAG: tail fiber domain-containing protein [Bacteroidota bacterium]